MALRPGEGFRPIDREAIESSLARLFKAQASLHPDRLAVVADGCRLTYQDLDRESDRLAWHLQSRGDMSGKPVALLFEQGAPVICALLGVLKAGGLYMPLHPAHPAEWIRAVIGRAGAAPLVCDSRHAALATSCGADVIRWDDLPEWDAARRPEITTGPDDDAYLYYTSGSTGEPKGVADTHRNVIHNTRRYVNGFGIGSGDRLTLLQPQAFSGAVSSMYSALLTGACLYPIDPVKASARRLREWAASHRITMWHSTPALFRLLAGSRTDLPWLRVVRLEGDRATPADAALFQRICAGDAVLSNGLGTTETGLVRRFLLGTRDPVPADLLPVGYPIEDVDVEVVSEDGTPVVGEAGEVVVRSRYLAAGYWRDPDLTWERFSEDASEPGMRSYRTGDIGLMRADGCLELHGRRDEQFKVRGQWASLGVVEAVLGQAPGVGACACTLSGSRHGENRIAAFYTSNGTPAPGASMLRRWLGERLPPHLIPSRFDEVDRLPMTQNGKIDRRLLAAFGRQ